MSVSCPWQLYTFCVFQLIYSLGLYGFVGDPCRIFAGAPCLPGGEVYTCRALAFGCLYVGVLFAVLTFNNKDDAPKLKRLAMFATNCVVMMISALMFTGSRTLGGVESAGLHLADMIALFALLFITVSAMADGSEVAGSSSPVVGLGINPKALILLAVMASFVKILAFSDFVDYSSFLYRPETTTNLSDRLWTWMNIVVFEVLFALVFTLTYGNEKDQETVTISIVALTIIGMVSIVPIAGHLAESLLKKMAVPGCVFIGLAIAAVIGGRCGQRRGYDAM